jgi:AcrR family transcriptional regulator
MPKVDKEYFRRKEEFIIDAAIRVCKTKPVYEVTLRDVIRESGVSPGGMYCYFSSIDGIFAAIINRCYRETHLEGGTRRIFESEKSPETVIKTAFSTWGRIIDKLVSAYGKMINEFDMIYFVDSERAEKIMALVTSDNHYGMIEAMLPAYIDEHIRNGYFKPEVPKEYIFLVTVTSMHGIKKALPFSNEISEFHNSIGLDGEHRSIQGMAEALSIVVIDLLKQKAGR